MKHRNFYFGRFLAIAFFVVGLLAKADGYVMPATEPMTQDEILALVDTLTGFVPLGDSGYQGIDPATKAPCSISFSLENSKQAVGFTFFGLNLGFGGGGGGGGDAVNFFLVKKAIQDLSDGVRTIDFAVVNRAGFGHDRMLAYSIVSKNGIPRDYKSGAALSEGTFQPGETILPVFRVLTCNNLVRTK